MSFAAASVIIPTYNGKEKIIRILQCIEKQTRTDVEVVVVVDGSTDDTASVLRSMSWNIADLQIIEQKNKGRAGARNTGVKNAITDVLIFFDDDIIPDSSCIEQYLQFHATHPAPVLVIGKIIEQITEDDTEINRYKHYLTSGWDTLLQPYENQFFPVTQVYLNAGNFSVSKDLFLSYSGFDERLKDIEDYDFALRINQDKVPVFYLSTSKVIHKDVFTFRKYADRTKAYHSNRMLAASLTPGLYKNDPILTHHTSAFKLFVYALAGKRFWLTLMDQANVFQYVLPKRMRFRLYNIIITGYSRNP